MIDFGDRSNIVSTDKTNLEKTPELQTINGVSLQTLFETKVRKAKKATPHTFRRPSYMKYIEYS